MRCGGVGQANENLGKRHWKAAPAAGRTTMFARPKGTPRRPSLAGGLPASGLPADGFADGGPGRVRIAPRSDTMALPPAAQPATDLFRTRSPMPLDLVA